MKNCCHVNFPQSFSIALFFYLNVIILDVGCESISPKPAISILTASVSHNEPQGKSSFKFCDFKTWFNLVNFKFHFLVFTESLANIFFSEML